MTSDPYETLIARIAESSGLDFPLARRPQLVAATERAMRHAGLTAVEDYVVGLACGRLPIADLLEEVVVGETYFFREPAQFAFLRDVVLPEITSRKPAPLPIRVWSAACASGEEAYSLAILLEEMGLGERGQVLGTDLSRAALAKAARATYGAWSLRGEGAARARRHMRPDGRLHALDPAIRERVKLERLNLTSDEYPAPDRGIAELDLVLCRNVLIYFDRKTIAHVARRLHDSLAQGGWLVLGSSDPPLAEHAPFRKVVTDGGVFYRRLAAGTEVRVPPWTARREATPRPVRGPRAVASSSSPPPVVVVVVVETHEVSSDASDLLRAEEDARAALRADPLLPAAHHRFALVAMELGHDAKAAEALRRAIYLDRDLVMAHLALGLLKQRSGDARGARRSFRTVRRLCEALPGADPVPLADGACAAHIAAIAVTQDAALPPTSSKRHGS